MASKLHQVIAVVPSKKKHAEEVLTNIYHRVQKPPLFLGQTRVYQPKEEDGDRFPSEMQILQAKVTDLVSEATTALTELFDVVATQDKANCSAKADVVVDGRTLLKDVPATHLLFLDHKLVDINTFVSKLPTLDSTDSWKYDANTDQYASDPVETVKTKKVPRTLVKAVATKEHPAQVDVWQEDVVVGHWKTTKFSGAISAKDKNEILERIRKLKEAVLKAREEANTIQTENVSEGKVLLSYIFGK